MYDSTYRYNREAKCPYCDYEDGDSWDLHGDDGSTYCPSCEKQYMYERHTEITYSTAKADCLNDDAPHQWDRMVGSPREYFENRERCTVCDTDRVKPAEAAA